MRLSITKFMLLLTFAICLISSKVSANRKGEKDCDDDNEDDDNTGKHGHHKTTSAMNETSVIISTTVWSMPTNTNEHAKSTRHQHSTEDSSSSMYQSSGSYSSGSSQTFDYTSSGSPQQTVTYSSETLQPSASFSRGPLLTSSDSHPSIYEPSASAPGTVTSTRYQVATNTPTTGDNESPVGSTASRKTIVTPFVLAVILFAMMILA
ncbi:uncharacterized protein EV154DRAFT_551102 [Mucor mucedo]|uniref:uncharacterized protein n=1 Tax=Mucor mucedo TaxID=29922 RepID=UPI002220C355|nr:uncharacterized protein EV154DRAFT_551102 [Mucor mucedo]KAI7891950.1 hypothetical protein EV154DRAFT_551102 [Mucor mucedo]